MTGKRLAHLHIYLFSFTDTNKSPVTAHTCLYHQRSRHITTTHEEGTRGLCMDGRLGGGTAGSNQRGNREEGQSEVSL